MLPHVLVLAAVAVVSYAPPVDAPVVDAFRPPSSAYAAGNRGIDYPTAPGSAAQAAADGTVTFAGRIGASSHVVVLHADGVRTSYSFLQSTDVRRGDRVSQGDVVGRTGRSLHFGARVGDEYVDPTVLLGSGPPKVRLVPADLRRPLTEAEERRGVVAGLTGLLRGAAGAAGAAGRGAVTLADLAADAGWAAVEPALLAVEAQLRRFEEGARAVAHMANVPGWHAAIGVRAERVAHDQVACTPASTAAPAAPGAGRIAVVVAGLGSRSGGGAVTEVDTATLGYDDVVPYSYRGGDEPYAPSDTWGDIGVAGDHLRDLLVDVAARHPGVAVDVIAHSQGGLVTRAALDGADAWDPAMPVVANVVTLGTPHHGSPFATAGTAIGLHPRGPALQRGVAGATAGLVPADARSVQQMSSGSTFIAGLNRRSLPAGTRFTSIAASGDLVVGASRSAIRDAANVLVDVRGVTAHDELPGHPATQREIALALAGLGPTCRNTSGDVRLAWAILAAERSPDLVGRVEAEMHRLTPLPWSPPPPVHSAAAPGGIGPPG